MKKLLLFLAFLISVTTINAQLINVNPNKDAEPWMAGGLRLPSQEEIDAIPTLELPSSYRNKDVMELPVSLDNSENMFFRGVFNQSDGSCSQASGIGYTFTYEVNRYRGTSANSNTRRYPSHYTYNFLNDGSGSNGSWYTDGWNIIKAGGCPTVTQYGGMTNGANYWMSGYDNYEESMGIRVQEQFAINVGTPEGLETLKYWMYDHLDGSDTGGIVNFAAGVSDVFTMTYDDKVIKWGNAVNHAMTFIGWDDTITHDYNGDGNYTNNIDINDDGVVDMKDWEVGALIMVNTWGTYFGDAGKAYVMYKTLADGVGDGGIYNHLVNGIYIEDNVVPELTMRVKMQYNKRNKVKIFAGISTDISRETPEDVVLHPMFSKQGGSYHMRGTSSVPIELSEDISELIEDIDLSEPVKLFLVVMESDGDGSGNGQVIDFSVVDSSGVEHVSELHNVTIDNAFTFIPLVLSLPLSSAESEMQGVSIYPNPVNDVLNISIEDTLESVKLIDVSGRVILESTQRSIDVSSLDNGVYFLNITNTENQSTTQRIIKN